MHAHEQIAAAIVDEKIPANAGAPVRLGDAALGAAVGGMCVNHSLFFRSLLERSASPQASIAMTPAQMETLGIPQLVPPRAG